MKIIKIFVLALVAVLSNKSVGSFSKSKLGKS